MLGHLTPPLCKLPIDIRKLYRTLYCSLCDSLRQQFGLVSSVLINHELNLVLLAFAPYFLSAPVLNYTRCPAQLLITRKPIYRHVLIDRAAEFCLLLGWLKALDWATDQPTWYRTLAKNFLDRKLVLLEPRLPIDTRQLVENYSALVLQSEAELATLNQMSAQLAAHIGEKLGNQAGLNRIILQTYLPLFAGIGELILSADHLLDFRHDLRHGQYNPVLKQAQQNRTSMKTEYLQLWHTCQQQIKKLSQSLINLTTNTAFITVMQHSLTYLSQQLYQEKIGLFDEKTESIKKVTKPSKLCRCLGKGCSGCGYCSKIASKCCCCCLGDLCNSCYYCCRNNPKENNAAKPKENGELEEKSTQSKVTSEEKQPNQDCCGECCECYCDHCCECYCDYCCRDCGRCKPSKINGEVGDSGNCDCCNGCDRCSDCDCCSGCDCCNGCDCSCDC